MRGRSDGTPVGGGTVEVMAPVSQLVLQLERYWDEGKRGLRWRRGIVTGGMADLHHDELCIWSGEAFQRSVVEQWRRNMIRPM